MARRDEIYTDYVRTLGDDPSPVPQLAFINVSAPDGNALEGVLRAGEDSQLIVLNWVRGIRCASFALASDVAVFRHSSGRPWRTKAPSDLRLRLLDNRGRVCVAATSVCLSFPKDEQTYVVYRESEDPDADHDTRYLSIYTGLNDLEQRIRAESPYLAEGQWMEGGTLSRYTLEGGRGPFNTRVPLLAPSLQCPTGASPRYVDVPESTSRFGLVASKQAAIKAPLQAFFESSIFVPKQRLQLGNADTGLVLRRDARKGRNQSSDVIVLYPKDDNLNQVIEPAWLADEPLLIGGAFSWPKSLPVERKEGGTWPTVIFKLTASPPLRLLFFGRHPGLTAARVGNPELWKEIEDLIGTDSDPGLIPDDWSGLVVLRAKVEVSNLRPDIKALLPAGNDEPTFVAQLLALSSLGSTSLGSPLVERTSTTALRLRWGAHEDSAVAADDSGNPSLRLTYLTATCVFDRLEELSVQVALNIDRIFGLVPPKDDNKPRTAVLAGQFSREKDELELRAVKGGDWLSFGSKTADEFKKRLFRYGQINALTATYVEEGKRLKVSVGGSLQIGEIKPLVGLSNEVFEFEDLVLIDRRAFVEGSRLWADDAVGTRVRDSGMVPLVADYSNVQVARLGDIELLSAGTVKLKIDKIRYVKDIRRSDLIASEGMAPLLVPAAGIADDTDDPVLAEALWLQLTARWAPQPSWGGAIDLSMRLGIGVSLKDPTSLFLGIGASELSAPRIDLGKVASFGFKSLVFGTYQVETSPVPAYPYFLGTDFHCSLFGTEIVRNVSGLLFNGPRGAGVLLTYVRPTGAYTRGSSYQVQWLMVGHNAHSAGFAPALKRLTNLELEWQDKEVSELSGFLDPIYKEPAEYLKHNAGEASGWLFGVSISFSGLDCIVLMADGVGGVARFHGTKLTKLVPVAQLALYYFEATAGKPERFGISISLPTISLGFAVVTGGVIVVEWSPNGSFLIDVGFPWARAGMVRHWGRALTLWFGTVQMSGGFYLSLMKTTQEAPQQTFALGIAGQYGYGIASVVSAGPATVAMSARIGVYVVVEGAVDLQGGAVKLLELRGVVGVLAEVRLRVAVWCISLDASVVANGEAELKLESSRVRAIDRALIECRYVPPLVAQQIAREVAVAEVRMTAIVRLAFEISFSVTIDLGLFKVERSFVQRMSTEVHTHF